MYFLKQCPRCTGDLATDSDQYGEFVSCLQCGYSKDIQAEATGYLVPQASSAQSAKAAVLSKEGYRITALRSAPARQREAVLA